ncbi:uncharacterized protein LOC131650012 [Vicia villosa]|uniref:uncharacterized protein LOC131650012 n=1 Tax=Vicia villosa TaxID=3911 RepID=UPI00273B2690|nr:uncharacterized protein LOC131650012 [Vicia villosa]
MVQDEGWGEVNRQKRSVRRGWDNERNKGKRVEVSRGSRTSFFFTSFPEGLGSKHMYEVFQAYGDIDEVVIPNKRDSRGRGYGFVRFFGVRDADFLAAKLDNIFLEHKKIFVNIPRFQRKGPYEVQYKKKGVTLVQDRKEGGGETQEHRAVGQKIKENADVRRGSYAEVLVTKTVPIQNSVVVFDQDEGELVRFRKVYIYLVFKPGITYNLQEIFNSRGHLSIKITPLGANMCLLEDHAEGALQALLWDKERWMKQWFRVLRPWKPSDIDYERITWLICYGIPCQKKMDVARILIKTKKAEAINEDIEVVLNGVSLKIKMLEDQISSLREGLLSDDDSDSCSSEFSEDGTGAWKEEEGMDSDEDCDVVPCSQGCSLGEANDDAPVPLLEPLVPHEHKIQGMEAEKEKKSIKETSNQPSAEAVSQGKRLQQESTSSSLALLDKSKGLRAEAQVSILGRHPELGLQMPVAASEEVRSFRKTKSLTDLGIPLPSAIMKNSKVASLIPPVSREPSSPIAKPSYFSSLRGKKAKPLEQQPSMSQFSSDKFSGGSILCGNTTGDAEVTQGNVRVWERENQLKAVKI